jgi:predicted transcriptional regulator
VICWEILKALASGPQLPTRLARLANVPYDRLGEYVGLLTSGGLVKVETSDEHGRYAITPRGMDVLNHLDSGLKMLFPALE